MLGVGGARWPVGSVAHCTRTGLDDPWVRRELQCQLSPALMRRQYIRTKESFALTRVGMLGAEAPGTRPCVPRSQWLSSR